MKMKRLYKVFYYIDPDGGHGIGDTICYQTAESGDEALELTKKVNQIDFEGFPIAGAIEVANLNEELGEVLDEFKRVQGFMAVIERYMAIVEERRGKVDGINEE
jgi:hypothetical protein